MKFTLISDMHIDFPQNKTPYNLFEEVVVVAGDTSNGLGGLKFLQEIRNKGFTVLSCPGNHENYANCSQGRDIHETEARFREHFPSEVEVSGTPFVLKTGWYTVPDEYLWKRSMNDSKRTGASGLDMNLFAVRDSEEIRRVLKKWKDYNLHGVVVTHMAPCTETLSPEHKDSYTNQWYWNPLLRPLLTEFSDQIKVWCHGHSHASMDEVVDGVRVVCNPRGYPGENPNWVPLTINI